MGTIYSRTRDRCRAMRTLAKGGASVRGIAMYFLRHLRSDPNHRIDLKSGISISAPLPEPLLKVFEEVWVKECYTPAGYGLVAGDTIVDIGANVGVFSLWAATRATGVRVISLEPSPRMFLFLQRNLAMSGINNVATVPAACGGQSRTAVLHSRGEETGNSLYEGDRSGAIFRPLARVAVTTLADLFRDHRIETCSLLKLDCEGAEYEILFQAPEDALRRIRRISMEYHLEFDHTVEELVSFLKRQGFEVVCVPHDKGDSGYCYATRCT